MTRIDLVLERLPDHRRCGSGYSARCPAHDDRRPSLTIGLGRRGEVLLQCHAGCTTEDVVAAIGLSMRDLFDVPNERRGRARRRRRPRGRRARPARSLCPPASNESTTLGFGRVEAEALWGAAQSRARDDDCVDEDRDVYQYLVGRGLDGSWEAGAYGIVAEGMDLHPSVRPWPRSGHQLVLPLYDHAGRLVNVQGRAVVPVDPKVRFPQGSRASGAVFANKAGLSVLRGEADPSSPVLLGEGLADHLALEIVTLRPVLCAPGAGIAASCLGPWVNGRTLVLAFHADSAGEAARDACGTAAFRLGASRVRWIEWPEGCNDAADMQQQFDWEPLASIVDEAMGEQSSD